MNIRTSLISVALLIFAGSAIADDLADFKKFYAKMLPQTVESFKRRDLAAEILAQRQRCVVAERQLADMHQREKARADRGGRKCQEGWKERSRS